MPKNWNFIEGDPGKEFVAIKTRKIKIFQFRNSKSSKRVSPFPRRHRAETEEIKIQKIVQSRKVVLLTSSYKARPIFVMNVEDKARRENKGLRKRGTKH